MSLLSYFHELTGIHGFHPENVKDRMDPHGPLKPEEYSSRIDDF